MSRWRVAAGGEAGTAGEAGMEGVDMGEAGIPVGTAAADMDSAVDTSADILIPGVPGTCLPAARTAVMWGPSVVRTW